MIQHKEHFHGSDLEKIEQIYGIKKEEITSFSANVNPLGISPLLRKTLADHIDAISTYPDREYTSLRRCLSSYTGASPDHIIVGNGSTELISLFIQITHPKKALILGPTYSEYEREISLCGGTTVYYPLREEADFALDVHDFTERLDQTLDLVVICNPNNPTSSCIHASEMAQILAACRQYGIYVMVDETYVEFAEHVDEVTSIPLAASYDNLIVLRGTSKFFAAPGLRLGYAVTGNGELLTEIRTKKNPWTINSLAAIAGEIMFRDTDYINETRALISRERKRMADALSSIPDTPAYKPYPAHANFVLVRILKEDLASGFLFDTAIREKMMIRDCSTFPYLSEKYIRFCVMSPEMNDKLLDCLIAAAKKR